MKHPFIFDITITVIGAILWLIFYLWIHHGHWKAVPQINMAPVALSPLLGSPEQILLAHKVIRIPL